MTWFENLQIKNELIPRHTSNKENNIPEMIPFFELLDFTQRKKGSDKTLRKIPMMRPRRYSTSRVGFDMVIALKRASSFWFRVAMSLVRDSMSVTPELIFVYF